MEGVTDIGSEDGEADEPEDDDTAQQSENAGFEASDRKRHDARLSYRGLWKANQSRSLL